MFLEFDISVSTEGEAIAAHPPAHESDLGFEQVLEAAKQTRQGIKLDFKDPEVYIDCLRKLREADLRQPLIINADLLPGTNAPRPKFTVEAFIALAEEYLPSCVLSIGWTTNPTDPYTDDQIDQILRLCQSFPGEVTFPVRAALLPKSMPIVQRLLDSNPRYSLSVWNNEDFDHEWIKNNIDQKRSFIDLIVTTEGMENFDPIRSFNS
jgi:hypothetical protein